MVKKTKDGSEVDIPQRRNTDNEETADEISTTVVMCLISERWPREIAPRTEKEFRSAMSVVPIMGENESEAL